MKYIKPFSQLSKFIDLVFNENQDKISNIINLYEDSIESANIDIDVKYEIIVCLKGPDFEEDYNIDIIDLFKVNREMKITNISHLMTYGMMDWFLKQNESYWTLLLDDIVFGVPSPHLWNKPFNHGKSPHIQMINLTDEFLHKLNKMYDYKYIHQNSNWISFQIFDR